MAMVELFACHVSACQRAPLKLMNRIGHNVLLLDLEGSNCRNKCEPWLTLDDMLGTEMNLSLSPLPKSPFSS